MRSEKGALSKVKKERQFKDLLTRDLTPQEQIILQNIQENIEPSFMPNEGDVSSFSNPFVALIPEDKHQVDHKKYNPTI